MKSLWMIIYVHGGFIGGYAGPLPYDMDECLSRALQNKMDMIVGEETLRLNEPEKYAKLKLHSDDITFKCEYHDTEPVMTYKEE
jgi:hypothetical protein